MGVSEEKDYEGFVKEAKKRTRGWKIERGW